ncbi:DUF4176 domain-containing protein [Faecalibaculum rodentium]|jgi:hypothetical protein|uniref:DUF4176 domain-containing protein n=2 Tax=Faecalibaculum rodentium TaxID=1702221 RepID=A0A140DVK2_9FIRM|nr:DUF4176 domain-containing protein [Faecalibaculum rodentium]AMK54679.1 hypothetical protein AALO17_15450 [Faecalibaculum rodentium]OLU46026.1 hypothetical protein BO223_03220 [Faecalibaculum rodentium]
MKQTPEWLPLGSVVTLKEGSKKLMTVGRIQRGGDDILYDYAGVLWPEGMIRSDRLYLFNHDDIDLLWYVGMQDQEEFGFRRVLEEQYDTLHE